MGEQFSILLNDGTDPVTGEFAQVATVDGTFDGKTYLFSIDYLATADGGTLGNDVSLVAVPEPRVSTELLMLAGLGLFGGTAKQRRETCAWLISVSRRTPACPLGPGA